MTEDTTRDDQLRLAVYNEACEYIRVGDAVAYTVVSITYPTAFGLFGWALGQQGELFNGQTFLVSFIALLWLQLGAAIFWQIHYKSRVRIELAKRIEESLDLGKLGIRHLTGPGLDYEGTFYRDGDQKLMDLEEKWRNYRPFYIEGLSRIIRNDIPRTAIFIWVVYAILFGLSLAGFSIKINQPNPDVTLFIITLVLAVLIAIWLNRRRKYHKTQRAFVAKLSKKGEEISPTSN